MNQISNLPIFQDKNSILDYLIDTYKINSFLEVGVRDGDTSAYLINKSIKNIVGIDNNCNQNAAKLSLTNINFKYLIASSPDCASIFEDNTYDIIYLDADHSYHGVTKDLLAWFPKVRPGGFLMGDDYCNLNNITEGIYGVVDAVEQFVAKHNLDIYISTIGYVGKNTRISFADKVGKLIEDNNWLIHSYLIPEIDLSNRHKTDNVPIPQFLIQKYE